MITYSGRQVHPQWDRLPSFKDYAVHMGRICRYAGALWWPDLAHCALVALIVDNAGADDSTWAWAFLHDIHEAMTGDSPGPYKADCLKHKQALLDNVIREQFGLLNAEIDFEVVKRADEESRDAEVLVAGTAAMRQAWERYRGVDDLDRTHEPVARAIMASTLVDPRETTDPDGRAVRWFNIALTMIAAGDVHGARYHVRELLGSSRADATL